MFLKRRSQRLSPLAKPGESLTDEEVSRLRPEWKEAANAERAKRGLPPVAGEIQNPSLGQMFWGWMDS